MYVQDLYDLDYIRFYCSFHEKEFDYEEDLQESAYLWLPPQFQEVICFLLSNSTEHVISRFLFGRVNYLENHLASTFFLEFLNLKNFLSNNSNILFL